ncbi:MAG: DNA polymerase IV [Clostridia bacterium]|nr:DNA polymerase IV [Clostridia bacterium]
MGFSWWRMFNSKEKGNRSRVILHCDLNNFFASVAIKNNPALRGQFIAVCGNPSLRKGIVLAKSENAKKMGVKTGMPIWEAQRVCPEIKIVPTDYIAYESYSKKVQAIYYRFTNQVESFGIDECWLDVTHSQKLFGNGVEIANKIRLAVKEELGLTISVGVSFNKTYAKLGSDLAEPDSVVAITLENYQQLIYPLPLNNLLFVGKKTVVLLNKLNIKTIGDLANYDINLLKTFLGINAEKLVAEARGEDDNEVNDYLNHELPKSVGNGTTVPFDLTTKKEVEAVLYLLSEKIAYRLREQSLQGYTIHLSIKDTNLQWCGAQTSIANPTNTVLTIRRTASEIFDQLWVQNPFRPIRALRVAVGNLTKVGNVQTNLLQDVNDEIKNQALDTAFDKIRRKYGTQQIMLGGTAESYQKLGFDLDLYNCDDVDQLTSE